MKKITSRRSAFKRTITDRRPEFEIRLHSLPMFTPEAIDHALPTFTCSERGCTPIGISCLINNFCSADPSFHISPELKYRINCSHCPTVKAELAWNPRPHPKYRALRICDTSSQEGLFYHESMLHTAGTLGFCTVGTHGTVYALLASSYNACPHCGRRKVSSRRFSIPAPRHVTRIIWSFVSTFWWLSCYW
jgi:hypothetical protein